LVLSEHRDRSGIRRSILIVVVAVVDVDVVELNPDVEACEMIRAADTAGRVSAGR